MTAKIIDGKAIAAEIIESVKQDAHTLKAAGNPVHLVAVQVGANPASAVYIRKQKQSCEEAGIDYTLDEMPASTTAEELQAKIEALNEDKAVTGVILQMPLPEGLNARRFQRMIAPGKDVEGMDPANMGAIVYGEAGLAPCTAKGAFELIKSTGVRIEGAEVTVVGHSEIVGKPLALLLLDAFATTTVCHIATRDLKAHTLNADILIVAVGKPGLIAADMIKPGACVIDIGINRVPALDEAGNPVLNSKGRPKKKTVGDVDFDNALEVAGMITPVPGGVGPMTVAMLLANTAEAAKRQA